MIVPLSRFFISGRTTCINRIGALTRTSSKFSSSSRLLEVKGLLIPKPALLIKTSIGRDSSLRRDSTRSKPSCVERSARSTSTSTPKVRRDSVQNSLRYLQKLPSQGQSDERSFRYSCRIFFANMPSSSIFFKKFQEWFRIEPFRSVDSERFPNPVVN